MIATIATTTAAAAPPIKAIGGRRRTGAARTALDASSSDCVAAFVSSADSARCGGVPSGRSNLLAAIAVALPGSAVDPDASLTGGVAATGGEGGAGSGAATSSKDDDVVGG